MIRVPLPQGVKPGAHEPKSLDLDKGKDREGTKLVHPTADVAIFSSLLFSSLLFSSPHTNTHSQSVSLFGLLLAERATQHNTYAYAYAATNTSFIHSFIHSFTRHILPSSSYTKWIAPISHSCFLLDTTYSILKPMFPPLSTNNTSKVCTKTPIPNYSDSFSSLALLFLQAQSSATNSHVHNT